MIDLPKDLQVKLLAYMCWVHPAYTFYTTQGVHKDEDEKDKSEEDESSDEESQTTIATTTSTFFLQRQHLQLYTEVSEWYAQSSWLFIKSSNQPVKHIESLW